MLVNDYYNDSLNFALESYWLLSFYYGKPDYLFGSVGPVEKHTKFVSNRIVGIELLNTHITHPSYIKS